MNTISPISQEEEHFLLMQDVDALSEEVIRGAWGIHSFEELNMVWKILMAP